MVPSTPVIRTTPAAHDDGRYEEACAETLTTEEEGQERQEGDLQVAQDRGQSGTGLLDAQGPEEEVHPEGRTGGPGCPDLS